RGIRTSPPSHRPVGYPLRGHDRSPQCRVSRLQTMRKAVVLYTIGHSNRSLEDFLALLDAHSVRGVADVRAFPTSRRLPHFNREPLAAALDAHGLGYDWIPHLGGRRHDGRT